jgi:hypothetical protein
LEATLCCDDAATRFLCSKVTDQNPVVVLVVDESGRHSSLLIEPVVVKCLDFIDFYCITVFKKSFRITVDSFFRQKLKAHLYLGSITAGLIDGSASIRSLMIYLLRKLLEDSGRARCEARLDSNCLLSNVNILTDAVVP